MAAQLIPVSLFALDQFDLPVAGPVRQADLSASPPVLRPGASRVTLSLEAGTTGMSLARDMVVNAEAQPKGVRVTAEALPGLADYLLIKIGGKAAGFAEGGAGIAADRPELLAAFVAGTRIDTPEGPRRAEDLVAGDLVTTMENGSRPLIWVARRRILPVEFLAYPGLRPISLPAGPSASDRPLMVSPRQRLLVDDWRAEVYFGEDRVLVTAEALAKGDAPQPAPPPEGLDYVMLCCDQHEILLAEGVLTESFHPGETGLLALTTSERAALAAIVAEDELIRRRAACLIVKNAEARALQF